jgi:hypothetical protein
MAEYRELHSLDVGGFGEVFACVRAGDGARFALKRLNRDQDEGIVARVPPGGAAALQPGSSQRRGPSMIIRLAIGGPRLPGLVAPAGSATTRSAAAKTAGPAVR